MSDRPNWRAAGACVLWATVLAAGLAGCRREASAGPTSRPSVILITVDTLRPDRLSCYGYQRNRTPGICSLARDGVLFERAVCDVPWTTGSMASVFTGQYAARHRLRLSTERLPDAATTLAEVLRGGGYTTGAIIGSFPLASIYNLNQGFQTYDEDFTTPMAPVPPGQPITDEHGQPVRVKKIPPILTGSPDQMRQYFAEKLANDAYRPDNEVSDRAIAWIEAHHAAPFFLWVHYFGPHERVNLFETWAQQSPRVIADYDRDLAFTDEHVGRFLSAVDALGLRANTLVILHADHGQSLGENDYVGHGDNLYQPTLHIPLLMRLPGRIPAGLRVATLAQNVDIFPTVLGFTGLHGSTPLDGADWSARLADATAHPVVAGAKEVAYSETFLSTISPHQVTMPGYGALTVRMARFGLLRGDRMYVLSRFHPPCARADGSAVSDAECETLSTEELFAPFTDAGVHNLATSEAATLPWFRTHVMLYQSAAGATGERVNLSPAQKERLRALGYGR